MRQESPEETGNLLSMEEYLRKRQAVKRSEGSGKEARWPDAASALKIAELLYV